MTKYSIIYPPTISWHDHIFQRPHQLQLEFARQGHFAILANVKSDRRGDYWFTEEGLCISNNLEKTLESEEVQESMRGTKKVFWVTFPGTMKYIDMVKPDILIFDYIDECVDEFSHWMEGIYDAMDKADLVIVTSDRLAEVVSEYSDKLLVAKNGADIHQYLQPQSYVPGDIASIQKKHKFIVGFHGSLQSWVDFNLIRNMALHRPEWGFVLVGPEYSSASPAKELSNVYLLGSKPYTALNNYVKTFDVGIIPFHLRDMTQSSNPIKMYEYLAAGVPVVATPLRECEILKPYVHTSKTAIGFVEEIEKAYKMKEKNQEHFLRIAKENSWTQRVKDIINRLEEL